MRAAMWLMILAGVTAQGAEPTFTEDFPLKSCRFIPYEGNAYFPLKPGRQLYYNNAKCMAEGECEELEELWITIEAETRRITLGSGKHRQQVIARVVEERETEDGELKEISRNYFSVCAPARDVYYFGEQVDIYEDGEIVSHDGAWLAGRNGALPGIIMPDSAFLLGTRYYQERAAGLALDRAEHVAAGLQLMLPAGTFKDCIKTVETSPLEPGSESIKFYCPGVGMVVDNDLELAAIY
ncbi:MAG TPA: hypothetical protein VFS58_11450 [Steroidobacteraceae bacterium]|nr:hypothetical protein [Steroidobacteraceae bacterium]